MSIGAPTYRSHRARVSGHLPGTRFTARPFIGARNALTVSSKPFKLFRGSGVSPSTIRGVSAGIPGPFGPGAARAVEAAAIKRLAWKLVKPTFLELAEFAVRPLATQYYRKHIVPTGFPGWVHMAANIGWTSDPGTPYPGAVPGDYTANGFDNNPNWTSVIHNIIDISDGTAIFGFRYWGHFHASNPLPAGRAGDDWEVGTRVLPGAVSDNKTRYRRLTDLAPQIQTEVWSPRKNIAITIGTTEQDPIDISLDVPRIRDREGKAKPANQFVWLVLKRFANAGGEAKEWTDILAEASHYVKGSIALPEDLRDTGRETQAKLYWLFVIGGINSLDWDQLALLIVENEIEDRIYGAMGQLSKAAGQSLGLTVGPQTGRVM